MSVVDTSMFADGVGLEPFPVVPGVGSGLRQWAGRTVEKLKAAVAGGLRFLPRLDNYTEETSEIRAGYRLMLREPVLKSSHKTKVEAVAQLDWRVIPVDKRSPRDLDVAAFVELAVERVRGGKSHMARSALRGSILDGFGVAEKVWEQHTRGRFAGKWRWKALKGKDTKNLTLSTDQYRNVTAVRPLAYGIGQNYGPDDFVIFSHDALFESALGTSDHRAAYGSFWFKDTIKKLWSLHLDKYVSPMLMGTYSEYPQKVALEEALEQARADTWLTIPQGATVAALQLATRGEAEFEAACDYQDRQMLIATSGAYLQTLEGKITDGRGDTSIHRDAAALFQWALAEGWQALINEQLVPELVEANFAGADPPQVALGSISDLELKPALDIDKGLQEMGFRHSREKLAEYYGREEATDPSDVLTPAGGGGGAQGSQGMRERFRRFVEWEESQRPFESFCAEGPNKGKPGPCPSGKSGTSGGGGPSTGKGEPTAPAPDPAAAMKAAPSHPDYEKAKGDLEAARAGVSEATTPAEKAAALGRVEKAKAAVSDHSRRVFIQTHALPPGQAMEPSLQEVGRMSASKRDAVEKAKMHLGFVMGKDHAGAGPMLLDNAKGARPYYSGGTVYLDPKADASMVAHEIGHHLERQPWVQERLRAFEAKRFGDEKPVGMAKAFPGQGFTKDETGRKDDMEKLFPGDPSMAHYVGKQYPNGPHTEILSVGMELLHKDPVHFARTDPEYFNLVVGILKGKTHGNA